MTAYVLQGILNCPYAYDARGNLTTRCNQTFVFDQGNRLRQAYGSPGNASYRYDGHGRRTRIMNADGTWDMQVYNQAGKLMYGYKVGGPNQAHTNYIYIGDKLIAEEKNYEPTWVHTDALGTVIAKTNLAKDIVTTRQHEPYGPAWNLGCTDFAGPGFTGHVNDSASCMVYMQQRYYDPWAGRFLSVDRVETDADTGAHFNRYAYANNNPYRFKDPEGNSPAHVAAFAVGFTIDVGAQMLIENKSFGQVSFTDAALSGLGAAITGGIGARLATSAAGGVITSAQAIKGTAAAGAIAGATVSATSDGLKGDAPNPAKMAIGAAGGAAGSAVGAKLSTAATASLANMAGKPGIAGHVGQTTQGAVQLGGKVVVPTSIGQEAGKVGADATSAGVSKLTSKR